MQKVQVLLQPTEIDTQPANAESRRVGRVDGKVSSDSRISTSARLLCRARSSSAGQAADVVGAEDDVDPRGALDDGLAVLLGHAAADGDLQVGVGGLGRAQLAEVAVELVVGVLAHGAGVEDDDVGDVRTLRGGDAREVDVAGGLEQPGEALGVVDVHLAPVGAHVVGLRFTHGCTRVMPGLTRPPRRIPASRRSWAWEGILAELCKSATRRGAQRARSALPGQGRVLPHPRSPRAHPGARAARRARPARARDAGGDPGRGARTSPTSSPCCAAPAW